MQKLEEASKGVENGNAPGIERNTSEMIKGIRDEDRYY